MRAVLGLPEVWEGIEGAVNYMRVLDADLENRSILRPLSRRFAQIYLDLNYEALSANGDHAVARVLDAYHDDPNLAKRTAFRRNRFSTIHVRRGRWWWRLATSLGFGLILVTDDMLIKTLYVFLPSPSLLPLT